MLRSVLGVVLAVAPVAVVWWYLFRGRSEREPAWDEMFLEMLGWLALTVVFGAVTAPRHGHERHWRELAGVVVIGLFCLVLARGLSRLEPKHGDRHVTTPADDRYCFCPYPSTHLESLPVSSGWARGSHLVSPEDPTW